MVLLESDTYREITQSQFLRERFARVKPKAAESSIAGAYTSLGLAGHSTLLEFFCGSVPGPRRYTAGLVMSFEPPEALPLARKALDALPAVPTHYQLVQRTGADGKVHPWYHLLAPDLGATSGLLLMLNQVTPEYYAGLGAQPGPAGELRRGAYLDAVLGGSGVDRLLHDIVSVTVRLRQSHADNLIATLSALGYESSPSGVRGPEFAISVEVDEAAPEGVTEVVMSLAATPAESVPAGQTQWRFGEDCRLSVTEDGLARWTFRPVDCGVSDV